MTLQQYLDSYSSRPFKWGVDDCALFASRWVENRTGVNHTLKLTRWHSAGDAARVIKSYGSMEQAALQVLGTPAKTFKEGDVALLKFPHNCMAIVGHGCVYALTATGIKTIGIGMVQHVWSV